MKKRRLLNEFIVFLIFIGLIGALMIFGRGITGYSVYNGESKINIDVKDSYYPGENMDIGFSLYDSKNNKIDGSMQFKIENYYAEVFKEGSVDSGGRISFILPSNAVQGLWKVTVTKDGAKSEAWFNVLELEKAEIKLEGSKLVITNAGNVPYNKPISISIGDNHQTALVPLGVGQSKEIQLTAPEGIYNIKVSDGTKENNLEFSGVSLTGNVVGLENNYGNGFLTKYPLIGLFLAAIVLVIFIIIMSKLTNKSKRSRR